MINAGEDNGLLHSFVHQKISEYKPPIKKGVPRGQIIGFSAQKHSAILFHLTSVRLETIAETVGISYKLAIKWRMEEPFRKAIEKYQNEFADFFVSRFLKAVEEERLVIDTLNRELTRKPLSELSSLLSSVHPQLDQYDALLYRLDFWSEDLRRLVDGSLQKHMNNKSDLLLSSRAVYVRATLLRRADLLRKYVTIVSEGLVEGVIKSLSQREYSTTDRRKDIGALALVRNFFTTLNESEKGEGR